MGQSLICSAAASGILVRLVLAPGCRKGSSKAAPQCAQTMASSSLLSLQLGQMFSVAVMIRTPSEWVLCVNEVLATSYPGKHETSTTKKRVTFQIYKLFESDVYLID